jgi:hypothetical protein
MTQLYLWKPPSPITFTGTKAEWTAKKGDKYHVTGVTTDGKRFKQVHESWAWASMVNLWRGTVWLVREGRRYRIKSVYN